MRSWIAMVALLAASCVTAPLSTSARPMTVAEVKAHEAELHGRVIRVRGEINNCSDRGCAICDVPGAGDACLGLNLYADSWGAQSLVEDLYRFATVVIDTKIDASCDVDWDIDRYKTKRQAEEHFASPGGRWTCQESLPITEARVISVESRKSALTGRYDGFRGRYNGPAAVGLPMPEASEDQYARVRTALNALPWYEDDPSVQWKLYPDPESKKESTPDSYYLCTCTEEDCMNLWPKLSGQAIARSPANPYICQYVSRGGDTWIFSP